MMMMKKTTLALSAALVLGTASTALAQYYAPDVDVGPYGPGPAYVTPYAAPYAYDEPWWTNRRALHQRRSMGDTNGF
jgi:ABC-type sugar transport system substrate-binding protein